MRARSSGQDVLGVTGGTGDSESPAQIGKDHRFATDDFEPGASDITAWPVFPQHRRERQRDKRHFSSRRGS